MATALVAAGVATCRTRRLAQGLLTAAWALVLGTAFWTVGFMTMLYVFWGTRSEYGFWLRDGAVDQFHRSGGRDFGVFVLRDIQGALFFHPFVSLTVGLICGFVGSILGWVTSRLLPGAGTEGPGSVPVSW